MNIEIYGADWCGHCVKAKELCKEKELDFTFKNVTETPSYLDELTERLGVRPSTIPQIFIDGEHIGGYTELADKL